jgi:hypothetical protein
MYIPCTYTYMYMPCVFLLLPPSAVYVFSLLPPSSGRHDVAAQLVTLAPLGGAAVVEACPQVTGI